MRHARRNPRTILPALVAAMLGLVTTFAPTGARAQFASDGVYPLSYSDWCVVDDPAAATFVQYGNFYDHSYGNWLHAPEVVNVYWPGDQPHDPLVHGLMGDFVTDFFASEEWNLVMPQYFTPAFEGDAPAVYLSSHDITLLTVPPGTTTVTDAQIGAELAAQMKAGNLPFTLRSYPEPSGHIETLYVVHMPPGVVVQQYPDPIRSESCVDFCAYHGWGKYDPHEVCVPYFLGGEICQLEWAPFAYALMPDFSQSACGTFCGRGTPFERYTESLDHELVEAITVPFGSAGWRNQCLVGDELSDVCEGTDGVDFYAPRHTYSDGAPQCPNRWARTPVWSNEDHGCVVAGSTTDTHCVEPYCGDGVVTANVHEQCDDGDTVAGDGCSPSCTVESGFDCSGAPSVCAPRTALETKAQQGCINALNKAGAAVVKAQGKVVGSCLKAAANGTTGSLGTPSQAQTAEACLTNDVQGMVAKSVAGLEAKEAKACLETPAEQQPDYAYTGAAATGAAATGAALSLEAKLFGASLDAALVAVASDKPGALCQQEVQKRTQALVDTLWKLALGAKKTALKGSRTVAAVDDVVKLRQAIVSTLQADANQTLAKSVATLGQKVDDRCASLALPALFPGACASASTPASLASCATTAARCAFCRSLALSDGFGLDCDAFDDGAANGSCS